MTKREQILLFEAKKVRTVWDEEQDKWYFSIVDVVEVLTDSADSTYYLKKMRKRNPELGNLHRDKLSPGANNNFYRQEAKKLTQVVRELQMPVNQSSMFCICIELKARIRLREDDFQT